VCVCVCGSTLLSVLRTFLESNDIMFVMIMGINDLVFVDDCDEGSRQGEKTGLDNTKHWFNGIG